MVIVAKYDIELSEWEIIKAGSELEVLDIDYNGFVAVRYKGNEFYLHSEYLNIPELISNY